MAAPPQPVRLIGGCLPPDIDYYDLEESLDYLAYYVAPLVDGAADEKARKQGLVGILDCLVNDGFCQAFLVEENTDKNSDYMVAHQVPYTDREDNKWKMEIILAHEGGYCGDYKGELRIPADSLRYGVKMFIERCNSNDRKRIKIGVLNKEIPSVGLHEGVQKRYALIRELIETIAVKCAARNISFAREKMPGTKIDFTELLKKLYKNDFEHYQSATFDGYYKECGLKFRPGSRPGKTGFWKALFPEHYS